MPRALPFVFYPITLSFFANPVWADRESCRNLEARVWVDGACMATPFGER